MVKIFTVNRDKNAGEGIVVCDVLGSQLDKKIPRHCEGFLYQLGAEWYLEPNDITL